jgi:hypothetical protein
LVQVIVPPTAIETGFGEYAVVVKVDEPLTIDTGVPVAVDGADGVEPQAMVKPINPATTLNRSVMCFSIRWGHRKGVATSEHPAISRSVRETPIVMLSLFPKIRTPF